MNDFEFDQALSDFLDDDKCEDIRETIFQMVRTAFAAGWNAARQAHEQPVAQTSP